MKVEPASAEQIRMGRDGRMVPISADVGGVVTALRRLDPHLHVRFAESGNPCWVVYWESDDKRDTYLVTTAQAYQNHSGTWEGLDNRLVEKMQRIDPQNGYDYPRELEKMNREAREARLSAFREKIAEHGAEAQHALRKDLGIKNRVFISRGV